MPHPIPRRGVVLVCLILIASPCGAQSEGRETDASDFQGIVRASKFVTLKAPLDGVLQELLAGEGDRVEAGRPVARMHDGIQRAALAVAELRVQNDAEMRQAQLALEEARILYERFVEAYEKDAASEWEVRRTKLKRDQAAAQLDALKEQRELAKANLKLERERLDRYTLRAPFAGLVVREGAELGATLANADPVISIIALDPLEAEVHLPVEVYGQLQPGDDARLRAGAPVHETLEARVKTVDPLIDPASRTFRCVFTIDNPDGRMPSGFNVTLVRPQP